MHCIDIVPRRLLLAALLSLLVWLGASGTLPHVPRPPPPAAPAAAGEPAVPAPPVASVVPPAAVSPAAPVPSGPVTAPPAPARAASPAPVAKSTAAPKPALKPPAAVPPPKRRFLPLGPPASARNWDEFRQQAARRLVQSNPDGTYTGVVPEPLLAIPVLEVELNADGSVRRVHVLRHPRQARDTTQLAIDAVHRAAPYGSMSRLPHPWKWAEVFLFDEERRFKPRELDK